MSGFFHHHRTESYLPFKMTGLQILHRVLSFYIVRRQTVERLLRFNFSKRLLPCFERLLIFGGKGLKSSLFIMLISLPLASEVKTMASICLQQIKQEAYLDRCFHVFCYPCIVQWSRVVTKKQSKTQSSMKCPLGKTDNLSIVHGFHGEFFQQHCISTGHGKSWFSSSHEFRLQWYGSDVQISSSSSNVQNFWKHRKYRQKNIWLQRWLEREIQALTQEEDVNIIVHHIQGVFVSFRRQQKGMMDAMPEEIREEFRRLLLDAAKPFLFRQTERFVAEVELFLSSGLNMEAYEEVCKQCFVGMSRDAD